jgi:NitT/TauT family transport system ATP-binding protein
LSAPAVSVDRLTHTYFTATDEVTALEGITFAVNPGEFAVLVGPSGCGKSTLLSLIAGLFPHTSGTILLFGEKITHPSPRTAYMLQKDGLLDWRTVEQNILFGLEIRKAATEEAKEHARSLLAAVGLSHARELYPSQLSGGMRQRVALVRTLAVRPDILLLDEPFSALDIQNKIHLEELLLRFLHEQDKTALLVTHDLEEAIAVGDRIIVLGGQPGRIRRTIDVPDEIRHLSPLESRAHPLFRELFAELWREVEKE